MKDDARSKLRVEFNQLKNELLAFIKKNKEKLPNDVFGVYFFILKRMDTIINELSLPSTRYCNVQYAELARAIIELSPTLLDPKIGGKIINAEKLYIETISSECDTKGTY